MMENEKHLLILIAGHFANAPRPQKEAQAAREAGFRVSVRGTWHDDSLANEDRELARDLDVDFAPLLDLRSRNLPSLLSKARSKFARTWNRATNRTTASTHGLTGPHMLRESLRLNPDLVMVHSEAGLWAAKQLIARGFRVGVDFEDWFSEDLPESSRPLPERNALKALEHYVLHHAHTTLATTHSMARALASEACCNRVPERIPNAFPAPGISTSPQRGEHPEAPVRFYWFSQTIGPGRGLELLALALADLRGDWELHLRGNLRGYQTWFDRHFSQFGPGKIHVHATVPNHELPLRSASNDVGLALEIPEILNRDLTATNKIFEYVRCGLAVIATRTQGQVEILEECPDAGWLVSPDHPAELRGALQRCIDEPALLFQAKLAARSASMSVWSWDRHAPILRRALVEAAS